ncbi:hypothetical protein [Nesterenkonia sp. PF2B19]|uniref:hypothetical protein n=1 Tax=Nesterenkonia sp. PF2B19 TaxID=1881858 RepID=UPI0008731A17|nr:hypothetical protein [Nesterenkonia sp. PF2B19]OSM43475.1 hypothetical protein BCY76_008125 [Nesterenkonia sp. PF2B19]
MTTDTYWHIDTIPEIVWLANRELWKRTENDQDKAYQNLRETSRLMPFLDKLTELHVQELIASDSHNTSSQLREKWIEWTNSTEALSERWYSPVARASTETLDVVAPHCVELAARQIIPYAELQLDKQPSDESRNPTYVRPADLLRDSRRAYGAS